MEINGLRLESTHQVDFNVIPCPAGYAFWILSVVPGTSHPDNYDSPQNLLAYLSDSKSARSGKMKMIMYIFHPNRAEIILTQRARILAVRVERW